MENFKSKTLATFPHTVEFWGRYIHDTFVIIKSALKEQFTTHLNAQHPSIKCTMEDQVDNILVVLDVLVSVAPKSNLSFSVYLKRTHTDHYLKFASHQPLAHKLGVIRTLRHRANITVSNDKEKIQEDNHLKKVMSLAGYPKWSWDKPAATSKAVETRDNRHVKGHVTLPYVQGVTECLAHILHTADIMVHKPPHKKICDLLVAPKDPTDKMELAGVIYAVTC